MRTLCTVRATMNYVDTDVSVVEWKACDRFPFLGRSVGVDTETELITDTVLFPPLVVMGVFDPAHQTCYIVYHEDVPVFLRELCRRDVQQRYFNLGFDEGVLDNEVEGRPLIDAIDDGRVRDMQIRIQMNDLATSGFIPGNHWSLKDCAAAYLNYELDKGDGTENSARLSFHRGVEITDEQARYLPFDCITTWALGEAVPEQPIDPVNNISVEVGHTKGMCVLAHLSANGFPVDPVVADYMRNMLRKDMDGWRLKLLEFGFPDPYYDPANDRRLVEGQLEEGMRMMFGDGDYPVEGKAKGNWRRMLLQMWNHSDEPDEVELLKQDVLAAYTDKPVSFRKKEAALWDSMVEDFGLGAFDASTKKLVMPALVGVALQELAKQDATNGYDAASALTKAAEWMDEHPELTSPEARGKPRAFFQQHVKDLMLGQCPQGPEAMRKMIESQRRHAEEFGQRFTEADELAMIMDQSKLKLDLTEKSGDIQLTLKDMWRLQDLGIEDKFLEAFTGFNHCGKYLSTYLDATYVKSDGRVHPRYQNLMRTGRTSCTNPLKSQ